MTKKTFCSRQFQTGHILFVENMFITNKKKGSSDDEEKKSKAGISFLEINKRLKLTVHEKSA